MTPSERAGVGAPVYPDSESNIVMTTPQIFNHVQRIVSTVARIPMGTTLAYREDHTIAHRVAYDIGFRADNTHYVVSVTKIAAIVRAYLDGRLRIEENE